jgi:hypothetical protein
MPQPVRAEIGNRPQPALEGAYALRQRLSRGPQLGPRDVFRRRSFEMAQTQRRPWPMAETSSAPCPRMRPLVNAGRGVVVQK